MRNDRPFHGDEETELRELLSQALAAPQLPLTEAQTEEIVGRLRVQPAARSDGTVWALVTAAACLILLIALGFRSAVGPVQSVALAVAIGNVGLSPIAVSAMIWRRRRTHAI
jgi:hypothetical protein